MGMGKKREKEPLSEDLVVRGKPYLHRKPGWRGVRSTCSASSHHTVCCLQFSSRLYSLQKQKWGAEKFSLGLADFTTTPKVQEGETWWELLGEGAVVTLQKYFLIPGSARGGKPWHICKCVTVETGIIFLRTMVQTGSILKYWVFLGWLNIFG